MAFIKCLLRMTMPLLMAASVALGQGLAGFGAKLGINLANIGGADVTEEELGTDPIKRLGFAAGGFVTFDFGLPVMIQAEALYSQKGFKLEVEEEFLGTTISAKTDALVNYLDINALAVYPVTDQVRVFAGLSISPFLNGTGKTEVTVAGQTEKLEEDIKSEDMNGTDMGLILGGGYALEMPFGNMLLEARYSMGFNKAWDKDMDIKNNNIQIILGHIF